MARKQRDGIEAYSTASGARWRARMKRTVQGRPCVINEGGFLSEAEAHKAKALALARCYEQAAVDPSRVTVEGIVRRYLDEDVAGRVRATTLHGYELTLKNHIAPRAIARKRAQRLTPSDVSAFKGELQKGCGARTALAAFDLLKAALAWAAGLEIVARNVADAVSRPGYRPEEANPLTHQQASAFLATAAHDALWPLWLVYLTTGLRRGEGLGLEWRDINFAAGTLSVRRQVILLAGTPQLGPPKSAAARRTISIDSRTIMDLEEHRLKQQAYAKTVPGWPKQDLVFPTSIGTLVDPNNLRHRFDAMKGPCDLVGHNIHDLRHTHATHMLLAGATFLEVSKRLGHARISITVDTYAHLLPGFQGQVTEILGGLSYMKRQPKPPELTELTD